MRAYRTASGGTIGRADSTSVRQLALDVIARAGYHLDRSCDATGANPTPLAQRSDEYVVALARGCFSATAAERARLDAAHGAADVAPTSNATPSNAAPSVDSEDRARQAMHEYGRDAWRMPAPADDDEDQGGEL